MLQIRTIAGTHDWHVTADWLGARREVFRGDLFACLRFAREND